MDDAVDLRQRAGEHLRDDRRGPAQRDAVVRRPARQRPDLAARRLRALDERAAAPRTSRPAGTTTCRSGARSSPPRRPSRSSPPCRRRRSSRDAAAAAVPRRALGARTRRRRWPGSSSGCGTRCTSPPSWCSCWWWRRCSGRVFRRRARGRAPDRPSARERSLTRAVGLGDGADGRDPASSSWSSTSRSAARSTATPGKERAQIRVTGHQWWWEVQYRDSRRATTGSPTANEIHIPVGRPVLLELRSTDVIHSFWPPNLSRQAGPDPRLREQPLVPGRHAPGVYRGQCAEFCGHQHAKMAFLVVAEPPRQLRALAGGSSGTPRPHADR